MITEYFQEMDLEDTDKPVIALCNTSKDPIICIVYESPKDPLLNSLGYVGRHIHNAVTDTAILPRIRDYPNLAVANIETFQNCGISNDISPVVSFKTTKELCHSQTSAHNAILGKPKAIIQFAPVYEPENFATIKQNATLIMEKLLTIFPLFGLSVDDVIDEGKVNVFDLPSFRRKIVHSKHLCKGVLPIVVVPDGDDADSTTTPLTSDRKSRSNSTMMSISTSDDNDDDTESYQDQSSDDDDDSYNPFVDSNEYPCEFSDTE